MLTPTQHEVIQFLAAGSTLLDAAKAANIHRNTIGHWRRTNPDFANTLASAHYDRMLHFRDMAEKQASLAMDTIEYLMTDLDIPASIRLKAALAIMKECTTLPPPQPEVNDFTDFATGEESPAEPACPEAAPREEPQIERNQHNSAQSPGRNARCPCNSGLKYKQCCLNKSPSPVPKAA